MGKCICVSTDENMYVVSEDLTSLDQLASACSSDALV